MRKLHSPMFKQVDDSLVGSLPDSYLTELMHLRLGTMKKLFGSW